MAGRLAVFLGVTFAISWGWWLWLLAQGLRVGPESTASHLPGLMGPMLGAGAAAALAGGRGDLARLARRVLRRPERPGLAAAAILAPLVAAALAFAAMGALGTPLPPLADFLAYPGVAGTLAAPLGLLLVILLNGYGEEIGWRGWLFPELQPRLGALRATLAVAGVWAVWHLPLFWLNLTMAALVGPMLAGWLVALILGSFALNWLWVRTGSVSVLALWHVGYNLTTSTPATAGTVAAVTSTLVMLWGAAVAVAWWRRAPPVRD